MTEYKIGEIEDKVPMPDRFTIPTDNFKLGELAIKVNEPIGQSRFIPIPVDVKEPTLRSAIYKEIDAAEKAGHGEFMLRKSMKEGVVGFRVWRVNKNMMQQLDEKKETSEQSQAA
jgi:hypothetical protein